MHEVFLFLAFFGVVYGAYALHSLGMAVKAHQYEIAQKEEELAERSQRGGLYGFAFRIVQFLYWIVTLPLKSVPASLGVAFLMVLPALLTR